MTLSHDGGDAPQTGSPHTIQDSALSDDVRQEYPTKQLLPCWLSTAEKEQAQALLEIDWIVLDENPDEWETPGFEYKVGKAHGWQFWSAPGEVCILASKNGAAFGLCLEAIEPEPDFEDELKKAKQAIGAVIRRQKTQAPKQLSLFGCVK